MAKLDDVSWHAGGDYFPPGLPDENGATHIGFFVTWTIRNDQWSNFLGPAAAAGIEAVRSGQLSGREFLLRQCDGKLLTEMLKPQFIPFAEPYYRRKFTRDYQSRRPHVRLSGPRYGSELQENRRRHRTTL
jgi:hypothetical protein